MFRLVVVSCLAVAALAAFYEDSAKEFVGKINNEAGNFKAGHNPYFEGKSLESVKRLMGAMHDPKHFSMAPQRDFHESVPANLPSKFVSGVDKWPKCHSTINFIKDQSDCGSCWAVAASEVVSDRVCITNYATIPEADTNLNEPKPAVDMSAEQILSCCNYCGYGCNGGYPIDAMRYWQWNGVVSGGWYGSKCGCQPYEIRPGEYGSHPTPACHQTCRANFPRTYNADKHKASGYYTLPNNAGRIQQEIYENGPIECAFQVYENFMHYKSGVYDHIEGRHLGGHAIKVVGWGVQNGVPYWEVHNSWNTTWGNHGKFLYKRGVNLGGFESGCVAGKAIAKDQHVLLEC